jgi:flagellar biogenesis protein FliO
MKKILFVAISIILLITIPKTTKADETLQDKSDTIKKESFGGNADYSLWRSIGALLLVFGVLFAVNSYLKRRQQSGFIKKSEKRLFILERAVISQKHQLVLASIDGEDYLVGVAPENISFIKLISTKSVEQNGEESTAA